MNGPRQDETCHENKLHREQSTVKPRPISRTFVAVLVFVCLALAAEIFVLSKENHRLRGEVATPALGSDSPGRPPSE